jgi:hypothetical protein
MYKKDIAQGTSASPYRVLDIPVVSLVAVEPSGTGLHFFKNNIE